MLLNSKNHNGVALTIAIIMILVIIILGIVALNLAFNYRKLSDSVSAAHVQAYFRSQAGIVNARWRIRNDYTTGLTPAGTFTNAAYDPGSYQIDIDGDGVNDVIVDIGPVNMVPNQPTTGLRSISSQGLQEQS